MSETKRFFTIFGIILLALCTFYYFNTAYLKAEVKSSNNDYFKDIFFVYQDSCKSGYGCMFFPSVSLVLDTDPKTFSNIQLDRADYHGVSGYLKDNKHVFFDYEYHKPFKSLGAVDIASFEVLTRYFARDKDHVFYGDLVINNADPKTFTVWGSTCAYGKDKNNVYYENQIISGADIVSFRSIGGDAPLGCNLADKYSFYKNGVRDN